MVQKNLCKLQFNFFPLIIVLLLISCFQSISCELDLKMSTSFWKKTQLYKNIKFITDDWQVMTWQKWRKSHIILT